MNAETFANKKTASASLMTQGPAWAMAAAASRARLSSLARHACAEAFFVSVMFINIVHIVVRISTVIKISTTIYLLLL